MVDKILVLVFLCLLSAASAVGQSSPVKLNGGLEAQLLTLGRSSTRPHLTASMRITNKGKSVAYLLLVGVPLATDNAGGSYDNLNSVSGIASCSHSFGACVGIPRVDSQTMQLQGYTQIDPDVEIIVSFVLRGSGKGPVASVSANLASRFVNDTLKDSTLSEKDKRKQIQRMSLSFPPMSVQEEK